MDHFKIIWIVAPALNHKNVNNNIVIIIAWIIIIIHIIYQIFKNTPVIIIFLVKTYKVKMEQRI